MKTTKTIWVDIIHKELATIAIEVPDNLGGMSAKEYAEKKAGEMPPSERLKGRPVKHAWLFYAVCEDGQCRKPRDESQ